MTDDFDFDEIDDDEPDDETIEEAFAEEEAEAVARPRRLIYILLGIIILALFCLVCWVGLTHLSGGLPVPGLPQPTPIAATPTPPSSVSVAENAEDRTLGQMEVEYTPRMNPGASNGTFVLAIGIPEQLAGDVPGRIEIITFPTDVPPSPGARQRDSVPLPITRLMRAELIAPAFTLGSPASITKKVNLDEINQPTYWTWSLVAPDAPGDHQVTLNIYQVLGPDEEALALPPRIYEIEVVAPTATMLPPTPTATPVPPFLDRPVATTLITGLFGVVVALIGLAGVLWSKDRLPFLPRTPKSTHDLAKVDALLTEIFSEDELRDYCLHEPAFRPIYDTLKETDRKPEIIRRMLDHASKKGLLGDLLAWAKEANAERYAAGEPYEVINANNKP